MVGDLNASAPVRAGEELDGVRLEEYLREAMPELRGRLAIEQFPAGHSNLTYLVRVGEREMVLRRPPFGSRVKGAHDMGREFRFLSRLSGIYLPAPRPLLYCDDAGVIGAPFYMMERLRGLILRKELPAPAADEPATLRRLSEAFVENLARLHELDLEATGLAGMGKPEGYVRRQVEGWTRRYRDAETDELPAMTEVAAWLAENQPGESGAALIHNDYKLDNMILDPEDVTRIVGVLDWEMATIGDPLMDLGTALSYWVEKGDREDFVRLRFSPTTRAGFMNRRQLAEHYAERTGRAAERLVFYYAYGLFKLAVILQQIYYRWVKGLTRDERFAGFGEMVRALARQAAETIEAGRISSEEGVR